METSRVGNDLIAQHGVGASYPDQFLGYFGWPTVTRMEDGTLVVAASGLRNYHVCPFGRTIICMSNDDGQTWTPPRVINDTPLDDRDASIGSLGGNKLVLSWFSADHRNAKPSDYQLQLSPRESKWWEDALAGVTDESARRFVGSWIRISNDAGLTWLEPVRVFVRAPHGPSKLRTGDLLYLGKQVQEPTTTGGSITKYASGDEFLPARMIKGQIGAIGSSDGGYTWNQRGVVPLTEAGEDVAGFNEPHAIQLQTGRIIGLIRNDPNRHDYHNRQPGQTDFTMYQSISDDDGYTWSPAEPLGFHGAPPHLLEHSTGTVVCVYSHRMDPFGVRVMISYDQGETWDYDYVLRDDGPHPDLGYPSSVELNDGSILTVYYQRPNSVDDKCALLWSRWRLPEQLVIQ